jgi:hypothetical protein
MRHTCFALVLLLQVACGPRAPGPDVPAQPRPAADAGLGYAGVWQIEFALDSIRHLGTGPAQWSPAQDTSKRIAGRLEMTDSLVGARALASIFEIDFTPLLGRQISCFTSGASEIQVAETHGQTFFWFTPHAYDCGFSGQAATRRDILAGTWEETSFVGPVASGRFRMWRE